MHVPVLLKEVVEGLNAQKGGKFIDCTVGDGGHLMAVLEANPKNKVMGIDLDQTSLDKLASQLVQKGLDQRAKLVQGNFRDTAKLARENGFESVDGILLDLGFSSSQLDEPGRGLSFQTDGPLDMRLNPEAKLTAEEVINTYQPDELQKVIEDFGEERFAKRIMYGVMAVRKTGSIKTTSQLAEIIRQAIPGQVRYKANDNIRRVFQAIRIEVNQELKNLEKVLPQTTELLTPHGRLAVISFHSLEDRMVKEFLVQQAKGCICPPDFPTCVCGKLPLMKILTKKPKIATEEEGVNNPRSKSAKLRLAEKI